jgi:beta-ribofuranosylaminobenzene 5'-phosphate synthase
MNGVLGRIDGGIGLAIDEPCLILSARRSDTFLVEGGDADTRERILAATTAVSHSLHLPGSAEFTIQSHFPGHVGLGRGTQLALSAACALCHLYGQVWKPGDIARVTGRGGTSGIGTASFASGGFLMDGGHSFGESLDKNAFLPSSASSGVRPPEVVLRRDFPPAWKVLLVIPDIPPGASGGTEREMFSRFCPVPLDEVRELCHLVLVSLLPGLAEEDLDLFGSAVNRMQELGFKKIENGLQPPLVGELLKAMREAGAAGAGLSSFGPATYAFGEGSMQGVESAARELLQSAGGGGRILLTRARNTGAMVTMA